MDGSLILGVCDYFFDRLAESVQYSIIDDRVKESPLDGWMAK